MLSIWYNFVKWYAQTFGYPWVWQGYDHWWKRVIWTVKCTIKLLCGMFRSKLILKFENKCLLIAKPKELDLGFELMLICVTDILIFKGWKIWLTIVTGIVVKKGIASQEYNQMYDNNMSTIGILQRTEIPISIWKFTILHFALLNFCIRIFCSIVFTMSHFMLSRFVKIRIGMLQKYPGIVCFIQKDRKINSQTEWQRSIYQLPDVQTDWLTARQTERPTVERQYRYSTRYSEEAHLLCVSLKKNQNTN